MCVSNFREPQSQLQPRSCVDWWVAQPGSCAGQAWLGNYALVPEEVCN